MPAKKRGKSPAPKKKKKAKAKKKARTKAGLIADALARHDSAEDFSRLDALLFTAMAWIFIPAYCFARP